MQTRVIRELLARQDGRPAQPPMLHFGPYKMPRLKIGQRVVCKYAGTVRIVSISDAQQQWPLGVVWGHCIPGFYSSLVRPSKARPLARQAPLRAELSGSQPHGADLIDNLIALAPRQ